MNHLPEGTPPDLLRAADDPEMLQRRRNQLRAEVTALLLQQDDLRMVQSKRIEAAYLRRFGALELKLCQVYLSCKQAKRRVQLLRIRDNRNQVPNLTELEERLGREFSEARQELAEKAAYVSQTLEPGQGGGAGLSAAGLQTLKQLYRQAVRTLHPDLHPDQPERDARLFQSALRAYRFRDLETLRAILQAKPAEAESTTDEDVSVEIQRLRATLRRFRRELERIKDSYPFNMRQYLEDPERGAKRRQELEEQIERLTRRREAYEQTALTLIDEARRREEEEAE